MNVDAAALMRKGGVSHTEYPSREGEYSKFYSLIGLLYSDGEG